MNRNVAQPGLARLTGGQKVESSNLSVPTIHFPQGTWVFAQVAFFLLFLRENTHETTRFSLWKSIDGGPSGSLAEISALSSPFYKGQGLYTLKNALIIPVSGT